MKRILLLQTLLVLGLGVLNAQTTIWSSDCESPIGWSGDDLDGDGSNWFTYSGGEPFGFDSGKFYGSPSSNKTPDNVLYTPTISIPSGIDDISFTMKVGSSSATAYLETYAIYIQEVGVGGAFDTKLFEETLTQGGNSSVTSINIIIPNSYTNKDVKLIIRHYNTTNQDFLLIDDLSMQYESTLSMVDLDFQGFTLYPNPVVNQLTLNSNIKINHLEIFNSIGQKIKSFENLQLLDNKIDLSFLKEGNYLMKVEINNTYKVFKLVKI